MRGVSIAARAMISGAVLAVLAGAAPVVSAPPAAPQAANPAPKPVQPVPIDVPRIVATYPHDSLAFTQGLFFADGKLFESTGQQGESTIREVELATGKVLRQVKLPDRYFGEGSTNWGKTIVSLTWQHGTGFRWHRHDFRKIGEFRYTGEGWGLTQDGHSLILSDGTAQLRFLDPDSFAEQRRITVTHQGRAIRRLNELEYVRGEIWANVWHQDVIVRIDPASGIVTGVLDLRELAASVPVRDSESVLNGIAVNDRTGKIYITGKNWPSLFEIELPTR